MDKMIGWHFLPLDKKVVHLRTPVEVGLVETHDGPLKMCESGLHFSLRPIDALKYAPGPVLREVEVSGEILMGNDKGVAAVRKTLWMDDVTPMLRAFARWCALSVIDKWKPPAIVVEYLRGGDEAKRDEARRAAYAAAADAAYAAAAYAAAAYAAAADAAYAAANAAANAAYAYAYARTKQNTQFLLMLNEFRDGKREWTWEAA